MNTGNKIIIAAFTNMGINLALRLSEYLDAEVFAPERFKAEGVNLITGSLSEWTGKYFHQVRALIFIGACGIAVRSIAPHITSKIHDPAVIVIDESGKYVIPVLSGHIGGANELARKISGYLNSQAVITTATDLNNITAVDEWAVNHDCVIENPENIKHISGRILEGHDVGVAVTDENITAPFPVTLILRPRVLVLGAGCNKNTDPEEFERSAMNFLEASGVSALSLRALASIDLKAHEPALTLFAENHNIPFITYTAQELQELPGNFTASKNVLAITGTDNVCERACILAGGEGAVLLRSKSIYGGITFALSRTSRRS